MKVNIVSFNFFLFVMVMFFPSMMYAPWSVSLPPTRPSPDIKKNCAEWIVYNGFTLKNVRLNRSKAELRDHTLDKKASTYAAIYAFRIGGKKNLFEMSPKQFCQSFDPENKRKEFKALEEESRYCEDWITLYGFKENDQDYNNTFAKNCRTRKYENVFPARPPLYTSHIALWAYSYYIFVIVNGEQYHVSPIDLCSSMGKNVEEGKVLMPFMCENDTYMTCIKWIYLYDYTDDPEYNLYKALILNKLTLQYSFQIQMFPSRYVLHLIDLYNAGQSIYVTPEEFCKSYDGEGDQPQEYYYEGEKRIVPQEETTNQ